MKKLVLLSLAACGLKVNINGQTRTLGGGGSQPQAAAASAPQAAPHETTGGARQPTGGARQPDAPLPAANYTPAMIAVAQALTTTPMLADVQGVALNVSVRKAIGAESPDCGSVTASKPVAVLDIKQPSPNMHISVHGAGDDGFIVKKDGLFWSTCTQSIGQVPEMSAPKEGWQAGRYEVYPVTRRSESPEGHNVEVAVFDPTNDAPWSSKVRGVKLDHKLDAPMLVEVPVRSDRDVRREGISGYGCTKAAFALEPDISLLIERPIPGLVIRPLPTKTPVTVRLERKEKHQKMCPHEREGSSRGPSWQPESEIRLAGEDEGLFGISVGLPPGATEDKVTLMIFDASTKFDPMTQVALTGPLDLEHHELPYHFPQLALDDLRLDNRAHLELVSKVFATAPAGAFVYPNIDLDGDVAHGGNGHDYPKKNEPLLVISAGDHVRVLAQDGFTFDVKATHIVLAPEGGAMPLAMPRPLDKKTDLGTLENLDPDKSLEKNLDAFTKKRDACVDRVAAPYDRQVPTVYVGNEAITVDDARTRSIRDAEDSAIIRACGSRENWEKQVEATRVKILAQVEKSRASLLATSKPHL
jgi:hypothetical protein